MRIARLLTSFALALGALGLSTAGFPEPALADCISPTIEYEAGEVARGETITITGEGFGDNCYDIGSPPEGQGVLGNPLEDIELFFQQGTTEIVVALGAANADYEFEVTVMVPAALESGEATIEARHERDVPVYQEFEGLLVITDEPASTPAAEEPVEPVAFGPAESQQSPEASPEPTTEAAAASGAEDTAATDSRTGLLVGGVVILVLLIVAVIVLLPRIRGGDPRKHVVS